MDKDDLIKKIEKERVVAFLTLANTGNEKEDYAYGKVVAYIDTIIDIVRNS
ncbi:MAG: hypothetical protein ACRCX8_15940 [Sarcina sp.]